MDRLRQKDGIDPPRAGARENVRQHAQANALFRGDILQQAMVYTTRTIAFINAGIEISAGTGKVPQLSRDAVHIDRQADAPVADQSNSQFFLPHRQCCGRIKQ